MNKKEKVWQSYIPGAALSTEVGNSILYDKNGNTYTKPDIDFAIRFWKRAIKDSGKLIELKSRTQFIKKSQKRREKMSNAKFLQWVSDQNR